MLSFIFVIVGGLFEWKRICAGFFYHLFIYVVLLEIQLSKREGWDPINWFNPTTVCACPQLGPGFPCSGLFRVQ
jgi:hypothetical protein